MIGCSSPSSSSSTAPLFFNSLPEQIFTESFGAIADCERLVSSVETLNANASTMLWMKEKLKSIPWERPLSAQDFHDSKILVIPYGTGTEMSRRETPAINIYNPFYCTAEACSAKYHRLIASHIKHLFKMQESICLEFSTKPLSLTRPMQDLRDRCRRVKTLEDTRTLYTLWAMHHNLQRKFINLRHHPDPTLAELRESIFIPEHPLVNYNNFVANTTHVFSKRSILFHEKVKWIEIVGEFPPIKTKGKAALTEDFSIDTTISIRDCDNNTRLGSISFHRCWSTVEYATADCPPFLKIVNEKTFQPHKTIRPYAIAAHSITIANEERDSNGGLPIVCLLARLAVEVFLSEDVSLLQVTTNSNLGGVFHAAGFRGVPYDLDILNELSLARDRDEQFIALKTFPFPQTLSLGKDTSQTSMSISTYRKTCLLMKNFYGHAPCTVNFIEGQPEIWEDIIYSDVEPLLGAGGVPALPAYNFKNLTCVQEVYF